ncbi:MAG: hypothetical protein ACKO37_07805 [Vampirovibrionales bacterium]
MTQWFNTSKKVQLAIALFSALGIISLLGTSQKAMAGNQQLIPEACVSAMTHYDEPLMGGSSSTDPCAAYMKSPDFNMAFPTNQADVDFLLKHIDSNGPVTNNDDKMKIAKQIWANMPPNARLGYYVFGQWLNNIEESPAFNIPAGGSYGDPHYTRLIGFKYDSKGGVKGAISRTYEHFDVHMEDPKDGSLGGVIDLYSRPGLQINQLQLACNNQYRYGNPWGFGPQGYYPFNLEWYTWSGRDDLPLNCGMAYGISIKENTTNTIHKLFVGSSAKDPDAATLATVKSYSDTLAGYADQFKTAKNQTINGVKLTTAETNTDPDVFLGYAKQRKLSGLWNLFGQLVPVPNQAIGYNIFRVFEQGSSKITGINTSLLNTDEHYLLFYLLGIKPTVKYNAKKITLSPVASSGTANVSGAPVIFTPAYDDPTKTQAEVDSYYDAAARLAYDKGYDYKNHTNVAKWPDALVSYRGWEVSKGGFYDKTVAIPTICNVGGKYKAGIALFMKNNVRTVPKIGSLTILYPEKPKYNNAFDEMEYLLDKPSNFKNEFKDNQVEVATVNNHKANCGYDYANQVAGTDFDNPVKKTSFSWEDDTYGEGGTPITGDLNAGGGKYYYYEDAADALGVSVTQIKDYYIPLVKKVRDTHAAFHNFLLGIKLDPETKLLLDGKDISSSAANVPINIPGTRDVYVWNKAKQYMYYLSKDIQFVAVREGTEGLSWGFTYTFKGNMFVNGVAVGGLLGSTVDLEVVRPGATQTGMTSFVTDAMLKRKPELCDTGRGQVQVLWKARASYLPNKDWLLWSNSGGISTSGLHPYSSTVRNYAISDNDVFKLDDKASRFNLGHPFPTCNGFLPLDYQVQVLTNPQLKSFFKL